MGEKKIVDGEKEPDLAWIIFQVMTIETVNMDGFLF